MQASDVMTRKVISVKPTAMVVEAARLMLVNRISGLPVVDGDSLVGVLSEGDLLRRAELGTEKPRSWWLEWLCSPASDARDYVHSHARVVENVMTRDVVVVDENASLSAVIGIMEGSRVKRLPVMRGKKIVGIVTRADVLSALVAAMPPESIDASDSVMREALTVELRKNNWAGFGSTTNFTIENAVVDLWGVVFSEDERTALRVAAANVQGIKEVRDHTVWIEPHSGVSLDVVRART